jgi:peptidyl-prolyl cis-trans isomerase SurA
MASEAMNRRVAARLRPIAGVAPCLPTRKALLGADVRDRAPFPNLRSFFAPMSSRSVSPGCLLALLLALPMAAFAQAPSAKPPAAPLAAVAPADAARIVAVVNGDVISEADVRARRRLLAVGAGLGNQPDAAQRLTPQVLRQLVDERLRLQEIQRRQVAVSDRDIASALGEIEQRNGMQPGMLRRRLIADGVDIRTMIDQIRVQLGWTRLLRETLGPQSDVSDAEIDEQGKLLLAQTGQTEYRVGEIFLPATNAAQGNDAQAAAETIITQLRGGAPFPIVAAQFSQSQTALQGGDLGWVQSSQLDPEQLRVVAEMPPGAISNPLRVPGGISIVTLRGRRVIGKDMALMARVRQVFFPFTERLDPNNPNAQQRQMLEQARSLSAAAKGCEAMDEAAKQHPNGRAADPGDIRIDSLANPALREMVATIPIGKASQPVIAQDGVAVMMVCERGEKNLGIPNKRELADQILNDRIELASRRLMAELQRRANIDYRS